MTSIQIRWDGQETTVEPVRSVVVGRGDAADIAFDDRRISRRHFDLVFDGQQWVAIDRSSAGSFHNDEKITELVIAGPTTIRLGPPGAPTVELTPVGAEAAAEEPAPPAAPVEEPAPSAPPVDAAPSADTPGDAPEPPQDPTRQTVASSPPPAPPAGAPPSPAADAPNWFNQPGLGDASAPPADAPPPPAAGPPPAAAPPAGPPPGMAPPPQQPPGPPPGPPGMAPPPQQPPGPPPGAPQPPWGGPQGPPPGPGQPPGQPFMVRPDPNRNPQTGTIALDDNALRLDVGDEHAAFLPGMRVVVGRDADCDLTTSNRLVSGKHCAFQHDGQYWYVEDLGPRGTFIDHKRIQGRQRVEGAFFVVLGDDDAGERVRVVTAGEHVIPVDKRPLILGGATLGVAVLAVIAFFLFSGGDSTTVVEGGTANSEEELAAARLSTAFILTIGPDGQPQVTGSGSLVTSDGLILTNAHVAFPSTFSTRAGFPDEVGADAVEYVVGFTSVDGGETDRFFRAEPERLHSGHDLALIRVLEGLDGASLSDLPTPLPIGTANDLKAGDAVSVIGFPGQARSQRVSVGQTNFQTFAACTGFNLACLGEYELGWLTMANESLGKGSSGGPIVRNGVQVGVQQGAFLGQATGDTSDQELAVPIDIALLEFTELAGG